jgi:hypothetical protein
LAKALKVKVGELVEENGRETEVMAMTGGNGRGRTDRSWNEQYEASLRRWSGLSTLKKYRSQPLALSGPLQQIVDDAILSLLNPDKSGWSGKEEARLAKILKESGQSELVARSLRAVLHLHASGVLVPLIYGLTMCETPIEVPMLSALFIVGGALGARATLVCGDEVIGEEEALPRLSIEPQAELGEHRVDFLLTLHHPTMEMNTLPDGTPRPTQKVLKRRMIVECDGHDFHDRTKEQARKDRSRDRILQTLGYRVFRYTGSEIWSDVFKCAHQAVVTLVDEAIKDFNEAQKRFDAEKRKRS